ncbi:amp dependent CoA ligase [Rhodocollybia butyracea]|uniref:Amp dependent CoA ligase n=1 Tax=Rhodocollybia butyracea TaxID=206335 RepID=A0A9P5P678_9AGAR|nr:amp dependent CoA ligase [Rhodocollybia butyracea]
MEFHSLTGPTPSIPDNLSVPQFLLHHKHSIRPSRSQGTPWFIDGASGRKIQEQEVILRTACLASGLQSAYRLEEDSVVLIFSPNHMDYPICIWAVHRLLGIVSLANPTFTQSELVHQLRQTRPALIILNAQTVDTVKAAAHEVGLSLNRLVVLDNTAAVTNVVSIDDLIRIGMARPIFEGRSLCAGEGKQKLAFLSPSSGTTGVPKLVAISHYAAIANCLQIAAHNKVGKDYTSWEKQRYRPGDVCIAVLPFYHMYGLDIVLNLIMFCAMTLVIVPKFQLEPFLESIDRYQVTHLMLVPPQVLLLCKEPGVKKYDLSKVRMVLCAGSSLTAELAEQLYKLLPMAQIGQAYGATEATGVVSIWPVGQHHGISGGELIPGIVARLIKKDGSLAGYNEPGELHVKTPSAALGYYGNVKATDETFVDGWINTGDLVQLNETHEVIFIERVKEIMKVRGFQVSPAELEGCILDHPWIADAGVVSIPDDYSGEVPLAFVVPVPNIMNKINTLQLKESVMKHVATRKAPFKHLARVEIIGDIPRNPSGKLLRRVLRARLPIYSKL